MKHGELRKYRVWHGVKGWTKYMDIIEASTAAQAITIAQDMYKQHRVSKAVLVSK